MQMLTAESETERQIRNILDARVAALRTKDAERFVSHFAADVVTFGLAPPLLSAGIHARATGGWESWFATWEGPICQEFSKFTSTVAEDEGIAYCHGLVRMWGTKVGGGPVALWFRSTWCLSRIDGQWKITHEHNSTPFYMDGSGLAALDLTP